MVVDRSRVIAAASAAKIDLTDNKLIVSDGKLGTSDGTTYDGLSGSIQSAYHGGAWDGSGVTTSMPQALDGLTTLAIATADQVGIGAFGGQSVGGENVLVMYTYVGDLNLDGMIDGADYGVIDNYVQFPGTDGYQNGDFNYDGIIDGADYWADRQCDLVPGRPALEGVVNFLDDPAVQLAWQGSRTPATSRMKNGIS